MITFFTHCRPFKGEFATIQNKAMESWRAAVPGCQVINLTGMVQVNEYGTALVDSLFREAELHAAHDWLCEISSDIVLADDFYPALLAIAKEERPFVIGQRWDEDKNGNRRLHPPSAADYFIYRRGTLGDIPPFAIGRTAYDNWLIWAAVELWGMTVINATDAITAIHQHHNYPEYGNRERMLQSAEREINYQIAYDTGLSRWYSVTDAPVRLRA